MPKIEVEEADFNAGRQLGQIFTQMLRNPKARPLVLRAQKETFPDAAIPEIDAAKPIEDAVGAVRKEFEEFKAAQAKEKQDQEAQARTSAFIAQWELQKKNVRERYRDWNEKAIEEVEKFAQEKGIPDFEAAAARYRELNPPAQIAESSGSGGWNFFDSPQDDIKDFMEKQMASKGDDDIGLDRQVRSVLAELHG